MTPFRIENQITFKEYRSLNFSLLYRRPLTIIFTGIAILMIITSMIAVLTHNTQLLNDWYFSFALWYSVAISLFIPALAYFNVMRAFKSSLRIHEMIAYEFTDAGVYQIGESFNSTYTWEKMYKVRIIKGWLLLYHSRLAMNFVKVTPEDEPNIWELKRFLKASDFKIKYKW